MASFISGAVNAYNQGRKKTDDDSGSGSGGGGGNKTPSTTDNLKSIIGKIRSKLGRKKPSTSDDSDSNLATPRALRRGGKVRKTGMALVHKGERMLTKKQAKRYGRNRRGGRRR